VHTCQQTPKYAHHTTRASGHSPAPMQQTASCAGGGSRRKTCCASPPHCRLGHCNYVDHNDSKNRNR
jgi:hypothetical protein